MTRSLLALALALCVGASAAAPQMPAPVIDQSRRIPLTPLREALTLAYIRAHYDPAATDARTDTRMVPRMIVVHWTATPTLARTLELFRPERLVGRADLKGAGDLNTGAQYVVDRDGHTYQLFDDTQMVRHTIGLNRVAIGIENVGSGTLTPAQLTANERLIAFLAGKYPVQYVIGHFEYGRFRESPLWEERDPAYFTQKTDPGAAFMAALRARLKADGLTFGSAP